MEYLFILIYLIFLVFLYDILKLEKHKKIHQIILFTLLVLLAGLRYRMAPDSVAYMANFKTEMKDIFELRYSDFANSRYQPCWIILNSICKTIGNYYLLQFSAAFIFNYCIFLFFNRISKLFFSMILVYFITGYLYFNMEVVRESLAIGFYLLAVLNYHNGRKRKYYFLILVAFLFHHFAGILFLFTYFVQVKKSILFKIIVLFVFLLLINSISNPLLLIDSYISTLSTLDIKLYELEDFKISITAYLYMLLKIIPVVFSIYYVKQNKVEFKYINEQIVISLSLVFITITIIRFTAIPFIERLSNYFLFFSLFLTVQVFTLVINNLNIKVKLILTTFVSLIMILFQVIPNLETNEFFGVPLYKRYYPYYSVLSKKVDQDRELMTEMEGKEW